MIITASMPDERIEVMLFDLFSGGRLSKKEIGFVLGIKGAKKRGRIISDAQAWKAREIVADHQEPDLLIDTDDTPEADAREKNYAEF